MTTDPSSRTEQDHPRRVADVALVGIDRRGRVTSWSPSAHSLFGCDAHEAVGRSFSDFVHLPVSPERAARLQLVFDDVVTSADVCSFVGVGGEIIDADVVATPVLTGGSRVERVELIITPHGADLRDVVHDLQLQERIDRIGRECALDERDIELLALLASGHRIATMARRLHLAPGTVRNALSALYAKIGVSGQTEVIELLVGDAEPAWAHDGRPEASRSDGSHPHGA